MTFGHKEVALPVSILVEGSLPPSSIKLLPTSQRLIFPIGAQDYIDQSWQREAQRRQGGKLVDSQHVLMRGINEKNGLYEIIIGQTTFKERLGTTSPDYIERFGTDSVAKTIGTDALILTGDQKLLTAQRKTYRAGKIGGLHMIGGMIDLGETLEEALSREIKEEVGLEKEEWSTVSLLGVTQSRETLAADVIFFCRTDLFSDDIATRDSDKEIGLKFVPNTPHEVMRMMLRFFRTASTPSIASLYLYGKQNFGIEWAEFILDRISHRTLVYSQFDNQQKEAHMQKLASGLSRIT